MLCTLKSALFISSLNFIKWISSAHRRRFIFNHLRPDISANRFFERFFEIVVLSQLLFLFRISTYVLSQFKSSRGLGRVSRKKIAKKKKYVNSLGFLAFITRIQYIQFRIILIYVALIWSSIITGALFLPSI